MFKERILRTNREVISRSKLVQTTVGWGVERRGRQTVINRLSVNFLPFLYPPSFVICPSFSVQMKTDFTSHIDSFRINSVSTLLLVLLFLLSYN